MSLKKRQKITQIKNSLQIFFNSGYSFVLREYLVTYVKTSVKIEVLRYTK